MRLLKRFLGGIRGRILLVVLLVSVLTSVLVGVSSYYIARSSIKDQVNVNLSNIAQDVQGIITDVWLPTLERQMMMVADIAEMFYTADPTLEETEKELVGTEGKIPGFKRLSVFLPNGYLAFSSDPAYHPGSMEELEGMEAGESLIIPFRVEGEPPEEEKVMTVAVPVVIDGEVLGVLAGDLTPEGIGGELGALRVGSSGEIYLVNGDGQLVTLPPKAGEEAGLEILGEPMDTEGVRRVKEGESGVAEYTNYAGDEVLGSYIWIPQLGCGLIVEEGAALAFSQLGTLRNSVILLVLVLALAALILSIFLSHRISAPLVALKTGAERLGLGDLDYRITCKGAEELESMVNSFNRMAEAIQSSHEMMEQKVTESTRELRTLNEMISSLRSNMSPYEILQEALQLCLEFTSYDMGWCYLAGDEGWSLLYRRLPVQHASGLPAFVKPGEGILGRIMERGDAVFWGSVQDSEKEELSFLMPEGSFVALPLRSPSRALGLICLASERRNRLSGESKATLRAMADEVGIALENAHLYLELQEHIAELEKANRELRGLDEMKSNFISAVTHELKQPLALIGGYTQTIHDYYDSLTYEEEMHCLRVIMERTQFLASLVEDLLDISMLEMGRIRLQLEELDMVALVRKVVEGCVRSGEGQDIVMDFPEDFPALVVDAKRIEQVLSNLLSNAVKFSGGRGEIRVTGTMRGDRVRVSVEDEGAGIDPLQLEKIFDRFYQADATPRRPYSGVGLGLFICRQLIEAHNGGIWAENRPDGGSAFIFELPLDAGSGGDDST
ncbi:MAG: HAMP domain-containing protein [Actinobacteria bacterium]|jgi:signal transduction histidine kinase|nr:MAG: HAMP domain-containing protein [Actinomycetota bacterium]